MIAPGSMSQAGYDPTGRFVASNRVRAYAPHDILDAGDGQAGPAVGRDADATWARPASSGWACSDVAVRRRSDGRPGTQRTRRSIPRTTSRPDGQRVWAGTFPRMCRRTWPCSPSSLSRRHRHRAAGRVTGAPYQVAPAAGRRPAVGQLLGGRTRGLARVRGRGRHARRGLRHRDGRARPRDASCRTAASIPRRRSVVASDFVGDLREYALSTGLQVATLPGGAGLVTATSSQHDGSLSSRPAPTLGHLYDTQGWTGWAPSRASRRGGPGGHLRARRRAVPSTSGGRGRLDPRDLRRVADAACEPSRPQPDPW